MLRQDGPEDDGRNQVRRRLHTCVHAYVLLHTYVQTVCVKGSILILLDR